MRLLDSRSANGLTGPLETAIPRTFQVTGRSGIPANATAVTGNLTVVGQTSAGFAFLGPTASATPSSSTLNVPAGDVRANGVTVKLGGGGTLSTVWIGGPGSTAELVFDLTGYFTADGSGLRYFAIQPVRVLDSREWLGTRGSLRTNEPVTLSIRENALVSPSGSASVRTSRSSTRPVADTPSGPSASASPTSPRSTRLRATFGRTGLDIALGSIWRSRPRVGRQGQLDGALRPGCDRLLEVAFRGRIRISPVCARRPGPTGGDRQGWRRNPIRTRSLECR